MSRATINTESQARLIFSLFIHNVSKFTIWNSKLAISLIVDLPTSSKITDSVILSLWISDDDGVKVSVEFWIQAITAINEITNDFEVPEYWNTKWKFLF